MNILFKALNDSTRREILELLKVGDMTAGEIADQFDMTKPSISHHLDLLKQAELIIALKKGQFIHYSLNMTVMDEVMAWFVQFTHIEASTKLSYQASTELSYQASTELSFQASTGSATKLRQAILKPKFRLNTDGTSVKI